MTIMTWIRIFFSMKEGWWTFKQIAHASKRVSETNWTTTGWQRLSVCQAAKGTQEKGHPPSRFQAIRSEIQWWALGATDESIQQAMDMLALDRRNLIHYLPFMSRLTKQLFKEASTVEVPKAHFIPDDLKPKMELFIPQANLAKCWARSQQPFAFS